MVVSLEVSHTLQATFIFTLVWGNGREVLMFVEKNALKAMTEAKLRVKSTDLNTTRI